MTLLQIPDQAAAADSVASFAESASMLRSLPLDELINKLVSTMVSFAINLAIAVVVFYIGRLIINKLYRFVNNLFMKRQLDRSLATFVLSMVRIVLYFILIVTVIGILGVETSSFIAIFASAGVAIGMALSGTLQNFAGGVLILLLKPYKIGDFIEAQGFAGTVREIQIFHTILTTGDNKAIIIPNGGLSTGSINNASREDYRRVDWTISISYGDDVQVAREKILEIIASDDRVVKKYIEDDRAARAQQQKAQAEATKEPEEEKESHGFFSRKKLPRPDLNLPSTSAFVASPSDCTPTVNLSNLGASSIDLTVRAWTRSCDYWGVFYGLNERFYNELPKAGINFPFPQLDVHTYAEK